MEPLSIMGAIFKVAQEIAKAARTARRNRSRCRELAERVQNVGDLLRDSKAAKDTATRRNVLGRLSEALGDALKLIQSCRRGGLISRILAAGRDAGRFDDVERKINNCLMDLGIANDARLERQVNQLAARGNHPGTNAKAGSQKKINDNTKKDVAMNGNKSSTAADGIRRNKGRYAGGKGKQMKEEAADVAMNGNKSSTAAAGKRRNKGRYAGGKGKQMKEEAAQAGPPPCGGDWQHHRGTGVPYYPQYYVHSVEEDPNSCSVM